MDSDSKRGARWDEGVKSAGPYPEPQGGELGGSPEGMSHEDVDFRSEISAYLDRSIFPAKRDDIIHAAASKEATDQIMALLGGLPIGVEFHNLGEVWRHLPGGAAAAGS